MKKIKTVKKYETGGAKDENCWPGKPGCKKKTKFKSKGSSREKDGMGILGLLGLGAAGLGGYKVYKKLKEQKSGGTVKRTNTRKK